MKQRIKYILAIIFCLGLSLVPFGNVWGKPIKVKATEENNYFYSQLKTEISKDFYNVIASMENDGNLKSGIYEYDLIANNILTENEVSAYQGGNTKLLQEFGAGRDAYMLDHAENFYTDYSKLSLSLGIKGSNYTATLGTGRSDNYYLDNGFGSVDAISSAQSSFDVVVNDAINASSNYTDFEKIQLANETVIESTTYDFCNSSELAEYSPYIRTAYGALINGKAVCEGYARALKVLLDKMNVENVLVNGYLLSNENALEPHMWNYVKLENKWYAIDPTLNDSMGATKYFLLGADDFLIDHIVDGVVSESQFEFKFPLLCTYNYGQEKIKTKVDYEYQGTDKFLCVDVSFDEKNASNLAKDGLYLAINYSTQTSTQENIEWNNWSSLEYINRFFEGVCIESESSILVKDWGSCPFVRFAVLKVEPNSFGVFDSLSSEDILCMSDVITNEAYDGIVASPFANRVSPKNTAKLNIKDTYDITLEYDEDLVKTDDNPVAIRVNSTHGAKDGEYKISNVVWDGNRKLSFTFTPSQMFLHNGEGYNFAPTNLIGKTSKKAPLEVSYSFAYSSIVCNKILDNGRLYMDVYGHPTLIDNTDLSMQNWQLDGKQVGENQRSQIALVVTNTGTKDSEDMLASTCEQANISDTDILSSATYEIDLDLCGFLKQIPSDTYMKLSFGFPQGYSAEDEGVTFKVYHFKRDSSGKIDPTKTTEIPCVITKYGLVVEVNEFSPFAVIALPKEKATTNLKSIYSRVVGINGDISAKVGNTSVGDIISINEGESITFTLSPKENYKVDYVLVNQKEIQVKDNKVTLSYNDLLENNVLEVAFVSNRVFAQENSLGITNLQKSFSMSVGETSVVPPTQTNELVWVIIAIIAVLLVTLISVFLIKARKNKKI